MQKQIKDVLVVVSHANKFRELTEGDMRETWVAWAKDLYIEGRYKATSANHFASVARVKQHIGPILAVGNDAQVFCNHLGVKFLALPYPSDENEIIKTETIRKILYAVRHRIEKWRIKLANPEVKFSRIKVIKEE